MLMNINQHIARFSARTKTTPTNLNNYSLTKWLSCEFLKGLTIMKKLNKQTVTLATTMLLSMGVLLSGNAFAKDAALKDFVTQIELETAINDIELTPGDTGAIGAQGPIGPAGADSTIAGPTGPAGGDSTVAGPTGATGADGERGLIGQTGFNGVDGVDGTSVPGGALDGDTLVWNATDSTWDPTTVASHSIGDLYQGGRIFYVDADGQHGLIAALANQDSLGGIPWHNSISRVTGATGDGLYAGAMNTGMIVVMQIGDFIVGGFAAKLAADYSVQEDGVTACPIVTISATIDVICYGDWYLPSRFELNLLYQNKDIAVLGGFTNESYWSSTEGETTSAWAQNFHSGDMRREDKIGIFPVRAVRAF
jgi:hypothetical protein